MSNSNSNSNQKPRAQDVLLFTANVFASAFDFMEDLERGAAPFEAAVRAVRKGKKRAKALRKGLQETTHEFGGDASANVNVKPLFVLCGCGCGLPEGQCQGRSAGGGKR